MKNLIIKDILTIYLEGEVNSYNAEDIENEIDAIFAKGGFKGVRLDLGDVTYISSAGLRIIVRIKQQYDDTKLIRVPNGVFDVLEMVGFLNLMEIERK